MSQEHLGVEGNHQHLLVDNTLRVSIGLDQLIALGDALRAIEVADAGGAFDHDHGTLNNLGLLIQEKAESIKALLEEMGFFGGRSKTQLVK